MSEITLPSALKQIQELTHPALKVNEFRPVRFTFTEKVTPAPLWGSAIETTLSLHLAVRYTTHADQNDVGDYPRNIALQSLTMCLYEDVLQRLHGVMQAIGEGEQRRALDLCASLRRYLSGVPE